MKHILFTVVALLSFSSSAMTQHINYGFKGGLNSYTISNDNGTSNDPKFGLNLGALGHIHIGNNYAFQPEVLYSAQGTSYKSGGNTKLKLNYVNIPLNFQYMFDNGFRVQLGPQLGILINANLVSGNNATDMKSNYKRGDIGATAGMSYVKPTTGFGVDLRYNHGLTNINSSDAFNSYNRGVQLSLFYLFEHRS